MLRQRFLSTLVVAIACLEVAVATAVQPSASALERQAQVEFATVGSAVRERLEREAAGDPIGARVAAQDADAHRYRYLDIKREISRLHSTSVASPSVEALRNPFVPNASWASSASSTTGVTSVTAGRQNAGIRVAYPAWDMYRPHESRDPAGTDTAEPHQESGAKSVAAPVGWAGNMYSNRVATPAADTRDAPTDLSVSASPGDLPREPFLVYRARATGGDTRE